MVSVGSAFANDMLSVPEWYTDVALGDLYTEGHVWLLR